jgi:phospholipase C
MRMKFHALTHVPAAFAIALVLNACGGTSQSALPSAVSLAHRHTGSSPIKHVIVIVQENRSFNDLFAKFPGADGTTRGKERVKQRGKFVDKTVTLKAMPLVISYDIGHCRSSFLAAWDNGKMDAFNKESLNQCGGAPAGLKPYQYVQQSDVQSYWDIAEQWVLADHTFQTQGSGSFTAHQDLIRGGTCIENCTGSSSPSASSLVDNPTYWPWGCDAAPKVVTYTLSGTGVEKMNGPFPCSNVFPNGSKSYQTLRDLLDAASVSWKYYTPCFSASKQPGCSPSSDCSGSKPNCDGSLLDAFDVIYPVWHGSEWGTNVSWPETNIFSDISSNQLPDVSWVIPEDDANDHPGESTDDGPSWVASVVNAIGNSGYWKASVVIVLWDDWGGLYDGVKPPLQDSWGGLGFRVPMMIYIEDNWSLGSLGTTDARATSIDDVLDYNQNPRSFKTIPSQRDAKYFIDRPHTVQRGDPE